MHKIVSVITASESYQCPLVMEHFCWNIVAYMCESLPTSLFEVHHHLLLIETIGDIFKSYCNKHPEVQGMSEVSCMVQLGENPPAGVLTYFRWVAGIHRFLREWKVRFGGLQVSAEDIKHYKSHLSDLENVGTSVGAKSLLLQKSFVEDMEQNLCAVKDNINKSLVFFLEDNPQNW